MKKNRQWKNIVEKVQMEKNIEIVQKNIDIGKKIYSEKNRDSGKNYT